MIHFFVTGATPRDLDTELLAGRPAALARWAPQHQIVFIRYTTPTRYDARHDLKGPILAALDALQLRRRDADEGLALDPEAARLKVQAVLAERGRLTNAEVRRMIGCGRAEAIRLMRPLREEGLARAEGRGRSAYHAPGPELPRPRKSGNPRRGS